MNHNEYKSGYYSKQEPKAFELVELYFKIVVPVCGIFVGVMIIYHYAKCLLASL